MILAGPGRIACLLTAALAAPAFAQSPREAVYFTVPDNIVARAQFATGDSQPAVVDTGTKLRGLAARYDGNGAVTLLVANSTSTGDIRAYSCPSATAACTKLGTVAALKSAVAVALDTAGNAFAVNDSYGGADVLLYVPRNLACAASPAPAGCLPGGYGAAVVIDDQVDGVRELTDVKVVSGVGSFGAGAKYGPGDVLVLAEKPARILAYAAADVAAFLAGGTRPVPTVVATDFGGCQEPEGLAIFPTGELLVATERGRILVFRPDGTRQASDFVGFDGQGVSVASGVEGGTDPVADGRVLVTTRCANRVLSFGVQRTPGGELVASSSVPTGSVATNAPYGVGDASLAGSIYTPASAGPLHLQLPNHLVTFEKVNTPGVTSGNYYIVSEATVRADHSLCATGTVTIEGVKRCVPAYARGHALNGSSCLADGSGCYYLVFSADTGADLFGGTQEHHFEEDEFGFATQCYGAGTAGARPAAPQQPRVFHATDDNDASVVEGDDFFDISTGCNSHIGRGGQFSLFLTGWDSRSPKTIVSDKLVKLDLALNGSNAFAGGLAPYIAPATLGSSCRKNTLAYWIAKAKSAWACNNKTAALSAIDSFLALVRASPAAFTEQPAGLPAHNAPGELIARAESAAFLACGAAESCQRRLP